ncbi:hypothetical protein D3C78_1041680 [compost metagenome]
MIAHREQDVRHVRHQQLMLVQNPLQLLIFLWKSVIRYISNMHNPAAVLPIGANILQRKLKINVMLMLRVDGDVCIRNDLERKQRLLAGPSPFIDCHMCKPPSLMSLVANV